jgi:hypothetical protein
MGMDDHNAIDLRENALFLPTSRSLAAGEPPFRKINAACQRSNHRRAPTFIPRRAVVQVNLQEEMWSQILAKLA